MRLAMLQTVAVFAVYVLAGKLGLAFASLHASATPVWPPAGIALAALLLFGTRVWPAVFVGAFVVNVTTAGSALSSLGIAGGNTLEALLGAYLVRRFARGAAVFDRAQDIFKLGALAAMGSTAVSATVGVASLALTGYAAWTDAGWIWLTWWLGDASGILLLTPLIVLWGRRISDQDWRDHPVEVTVLFALVVASAVLVFGGVLPAGWRRLPTAFVSIPPLLWAAYRFGPRTTSTALCALSAIAVAGTQSGSGPFSAYSPSISLPLVQAFLAMMALTALPLAAVVSERRRADDAVRVREEQLRVAVAAAQMGTWEWTIATGDVRWSSSLEAMHGMAPGTFRGTYEAFEADIHPSDRDAVAAATRAALEGGAHRVEYRIVRPDGAVRWLERRGEVFRDAMGRPQRVVGVCVDVTERKRADERNRVLADIARSISASLDIDTVLQRIADGARTLCDSDTAAIFLRDETSEAMVPRFRVGPWLTSYDALRIRAGEGLGGLVMQTRRPLRTSSYQTDPRVRESTRTIAEQTGTVALMVVPILTAKEVAGLLSISNRSARAFGDDDEAVSIRLAEQAAIAIHNARLFAREGAARAEAEAVNRSKDEFLAMLSHELRNPLGAISSAIQVLDRVGDPSVAARARVIIARQTQHLSRLVEDLLDVSRAMTGKIVVRSEVVDFAAVTERVVAGLVGRDAARAGDIALATRSVRVLGDTVRLEQVVNNLVENALKYTPAGGRVTVTVGEENGAAVLAVEDSGVGIAAELLPHVFDLFVQADHSLDRTAGGLGIGLTLVRQIVELHGGKVEAVSAGVGRGSRFTVRLPATAGSPPAPGSLPARGGRRHRILVVEDNDDAREMLCELVRLLGHEVHETADGLRGVEMALRLLPDLTLVDIGLPGVDGYEVARRIRNDPRGRPLRLVALTGYGRREDRERALAGGYDDHLVKPVDPARLAEALGEPSCGGTPPMKSSPDGAGQ
jgi:PAS domain S-box-containing protein